MHIFENISKSKENFTSRIKAKLHFTFRSGKKSQISKQILIFFYRYMYIL